MRDLSRRARVLLAGGVIGVLGSGLAGALILPASAQATSSAASATPASTSGLLPLTVCLTIREIHFGPQCLTV